MLGALLALGLVAYNNLASLLLDRSDTGYVVSNLVITGVLLLLVQGPLGWGLTSIGLRGNDLSVVRSTVALATLVMTPLFIVAFFRTTAPLLTDERVAGLDGGALVFYALVRIPIGTAFFEELAFRGVLFGAFASGGTARAAIATSISFGLWHVGPTLEVVEANDPGAGVFATGAFVLLAVVATTLAGLLFSWLRVKGNGIGAPWALHAVINSLALLAAALAHARV
jgi:membrane protease YdiL (CAAX protease family)